MRKNTYIIAGLISSVFLMTGCADSFLEVESKTQETIDTYFTTDEHVQEAVVAAYAPLTSAPETVRYLPPQPSSTLPQIPDQPTADSFLSQRSWHQAYQSKNLFYLKSSLLS